MHSVATLMKLQNEVPLELPFLKAFVAKYSKKVIENNKHPLFSKTVKYNNFPKRVKPKKEAKALVMKILNKITESNFEKQVAELLSVLRESHIMPSIVATLILEKVWYDKAFYGLYVGLCKKLEDYCVYEITHDEKYYYMHDTKRGPFETIEEATENALKITNFKSVFLTLCKTHFDKRSDYLETKGDETEQYKAKRKLFGTVEIVGHLYKSKYIEDIIVHHFLLSLLHDMDGADYEEEIEAFKLLWDIAKISTIEYYPLLQKELSKWKPRITFMIEDILGIKQENLEEMIKQSRTSRISSKNILFIIGVIKDVMEYSEYIEMHSHNIISSLNHLSFEELSSAFNSAGNDLEDIKIDAPKAPKNVEKLINNILQHSHGCLELDDNWAFIKSDRVFIK